MVKQGVERRGLPSRAPISLPNITESGVLPGAGDMPVGVNGPVGPRAIFHVRTRQLTPQVF